MDSTDTDSFVTVMNYFSPASSLFASVVPWQARAAKPAQRFTVKSKNNIWMHTEEDKEDTKEHHRSVHVT